MAFRTNIVPVLQTKSASGSVATFNTALAMPLSSCNIALTATQSGSGTPSPDNVRTINGYSAINIANASEDLYHDITVMNGYLDIYGNVQASGVSSVTDYIPVVEGLVYYYYDYATASLGPRNICIYDDSKQFVSYITYETVNKKAYFIIPSTGAYIRITIDRNYTNQHLYNGTTTTIQIGSTVYGGEYDARTGVLTAPVKGVDMGSLTWSIQDVSGDVTRFISNSIADMKLTTTRSMDIICSIFKTNKSISEPYMDNSIYNGANVKQLIVVTSAYSDLASFTAAVNGQTVVYEFATPTTIQLPPCPIDTLQGVNNIWADTGDVDLTYKDLDIAKRGNFREVFKLPS